MKGVIMSRLKKWGILFIVWGWLLLFASLTGYMERSMAYSFLLGDIMNFLQIALPVIAIVFTVYFLVEQKTDENHHTVSVDLTGCGYGAGQPDPAKCNASDQL